MKLDAYSTSDINMYISDTYMLFDNTPIKIGHLEGDDCELTMNYYINDRSNNIVSRYEQLSRDEDLRLRQVPMGFYQVNDAVVYLYKQQRSHYKKLSCRDTVKCFIPQEREFNSLSKRFSVNLDQIILSGQKFISLDEAFEKMQDKKVFSIALHPNYALVKKGSRKDLTIYYKTDPVITYDGNELTPLIDQCHVTKFKLELGL